MNHPALLIWPPHLPVKAMNPEYEIIISTKELRQYAPGTNKEANIKLIQ
jgi:hypothetical protein